MAQAAVGSGFSKQIFIVARYRPRGNFLRIFKENVGNKRASGPVTTTNPSPISRQSTTLLPPTALPSLTSTGVLCFLYLEIAFPVPGRAKPSRCGVDSLRLIPNHGLMLYL